MFEYTVRFKYQGQSLMLIVQAKTVGEAMSNIRNRFIGSQIDEISVDVAGKQQKGMLAGLDKFM